MYWRTALPMNLPDIVAMTQFMLTQTTLCKARFDGLAAQAHRHCTRRFNEELFTRLLSRGAAIAARGVFAAFALAASDYPTHPIRLIAPPSFLHSCGAKSKYARKSSKPLTLGHNV